MGASETLARAGGGIEDVSLVSIYQDKNGILWLGTDNDGVYKLNGDKFEKFKVKNRSGR